MPEAPDNRDLLQAINDLAEASQDDVDRLLKPVLQRLVGATLITERDLSTVDDFLALFTDPIDLHFFEPGAAWITISAAAAIKLVARGDYDGLVVNPGRRQLELSREDVIDFFEID